MKHRKSSITWLLLSLLGSLIGSLQGCNEGWSTKSFEAFKEETSFPITYSYTSEIGRAAIQEMARQALPREDVGQLLQEGQNAEVYPLHLVKQSDYLIATYLIKEATDEYSHRISVAIYDKEGYLKDHFNKYLLPDEYGSFNEVVLTAPDTMYVRYCDQEYSPDEDQYEQDHKTGYVFVPEVEETRYVLMKDSLKFTLGNKKVYSYKK